MSTNYVPNGSSWVANVTTTATSIGPITATTGPSAYWLVTNAGTNDVFFRLSTNSAVIATAPVTSGTSSPGHLINAGDAYIVGLPTADASGMSVFVPNVTVSAVTLTGTSQLFVGAVIPLGS